VVLGKAGAVGAGAAPPGSAGVADAPGVMGTGLGKFSGVGVVPGKAGAAGAVGAVGVGVAGAGVAGIEAGGVEAGGVTGSAPGVAWTVPHTTPEVGLCGAMRVSISPLSTALPCSRSIVVQ